MLREAKLQEVRERQRIREERARRARERVRTVYSDTETLEIFNNLLNNKHILWVNGYCYFCFIFLAQEDGQCRARRYRNFRSRKRWPF